MLHLVQEMREVHFPSSALENRWNAASAPFRRLPSCARRRGPVVRGASMHFRLPRLGWVFPLAALLVAAGCAPKIGKKCSLSTDCSQLGDRLCDTTQPDGYCTIFSCEPDTCPEAVCVGFDSQIDPACGAEQGIQTARFQRTFCMKGCDDDSDCRDGYQCADMATLNATIVDLTLPSSNKVCIAGAQSFRSCAATDSACTDPSQCCSAICTEGICTAPAICGVTDAGAPWTPYTPDGGASTSTSTSAGAGGAGGGTSTSTSTSTGAGGAGGGTSTSTSTGAGGAGGAGTSTGSSSSTG